ncbi:P-II family nitrogen regulator [Acaryochloris sp. 'Moss Beach']|uniref:P-II family nitrogen regulator n=1 Tax=Acaryochloris TaxID=155977 RepID=UPI001BAF8E72|nr:MULTISPECIES: P-II family nitrogen regulator [Acaryochloris]QUY41674.1 P-II family nitrogen regulator [Acaryochloris marina S15]UJB70833.1 P-II family nitrogen regulator [Acaryochloris sp. 'Moss Beach']
MHPVKKIEIIANSFELAKILDALDKSGVHGHAVIRNVAGKGLRGTTEDLDHTMLDNVYIIAFCAPDLLQQVVDNIRPLLNKFGGTCYVTDTQEIRSVRCLS